MSGGREAVPSVSETPAVEETEVVELHGEVEVEEKSEEPKDDSESVRDTVEKAYKELQEKGGDDGSPDKKAEAPKDEKPAPIDPKLEAELDPELVPPERFRAHAKALFNNLPVGIKRELHKTIRDLEAQTTRATQEYKGKAEEVRSIMDVVQPYVADWGAMGVSTPAAIAELCAAQRKLTNPETSLQAYIQMGESLGIDVSALKGQTETGDFDISKHPKYIALENRLNALQSKVEPVYSNYTQTHQQQSEARVNSIVSELDAVRNEVDAATGELRYPELQDDVFFNGLKPLVSALTGTVKNLSYGDALRRAYQEATGKQIQQASSQTSGQLNQTSLQPSQRSNRAPITTAVSVRGRITPQSAQGQDVPPPEALASPRETARWALEQLRNGRG
jgi:hypothetical protein